MSHAKSPEKVVQEIRRKTRRQFSAEEKIRIVFEGLRGEESIAALRPGTSPRGGGPGREADRGTWRGCPEPAHRLAASPRSPCAARSCPTVERDVRVGVLDRSGQRDPQLVPGTHRARPHPVAHAPSTRHHLRSFTPSPPRSAKAAWARSIGRGTPSSTGTWRSRCCPRR